MLQNTQSTTRPIQCNEQYDDDFWFSSASKTDDAWKPCGIGLNTSTGASGDDFFTGNTDDQFAGKQTEPPPPEPSAKQWQINLSVGLGDLVLVFAAAGIAAILIPS